jgi:hypothetical protein
MPLNDGSATGLFAANVDFEEWKRGFSGGGRRAGVKPWYATNARDLLETRQQGKRPAGAVVVSLVGGGFVDVARQPRCTCSRTCRWTAGLADAGQPRGVAVGRPCGAALDWMLATASRIAQARPSRSDAALRGRRGEVHDVEVGTAIHLPRFAAFRQHGFTGPDQLRGTQWGAKLRHALIATHPRWTEL